MRLLVTGDRRWGNRERIFEVLDAVHHWSGIEVLIEGEASGADTLAREWAVSRGVPLSSHPAQWKKYGKAAGPIRNARMLEEKPDFCLAFHNHLYASKGTKHMVGLCEKVGVKCLVVTEASWDDPVPGKV